ncbi:MAG: glutamine-hydrolyzing carbamoyl-phosphate synthase small subunit [Fimbriimonadaceae bacterium]|nr:glutamine-hydrolyzing carbamoyl-phosphate synthase small subunit [Fimbriimonadaceae bacterium]
MAAPATLLLSDGTVYRGRSIGAAGERVGEVCFNTSITGYQEILTDPSYHGQMVCMTYPLIGNYGVNSADCESLRPQVRGFLIKELARLHSNFRAELSLGEYLQQHDVVAMEGLDTRALTRKLRMSGNQMGILSTVDDDPAALQAKLDAAPRYVGVDLVRHVTTAEPYVWSGQLGLLTKPKGTAQKQLTLFDLADDPATPAYRHRVVCLDCGVKFNSLRELAARDCQVTVVPAATTAAEILALQPDGVYLSNGPGDPEPLTYIHETVRQLMAAELPLFGICLGHQMLGCAVGGRTYKLKFGHRGGNQPVMDRETGHVEITSQNHGFAVDPDALEGTGMVITHHNLNDGTIEGMRHERLPVFSVQYHPEASPGPHDANYLFDRFLDAMERRRGD